MLGSRRKKLAPAKMVARDTYAQGDEGAIVFTYMIHGSYTSRVGFYVRLHTTTTVKACVV